MKLLIKELLRENLENYNEKIYTLKDIKNIVTQNDRVDIKVHYLDFYKSPDVYNEGNFLYSMRDEYNPDKNSEYENELSFIKALWQRVYYFNKKGWYSEIKIIEPKIF